MNIDDRIQALTMTLKQRALESAKNDTRLRELADQVREVTQVSATHGDQPHALSGGTVRELIELSNQDGLYIRELASIAKEANEKSASLAKIAASHDRRIAAVEADN